MSAPTEEYEPKEVMSEHVEKHELKNTDSVIQGSVSNIHIDLELEKQTLRKFDIFLLPQLAILVIIAYLDRSNIGNAKTFGFTQGLHLTGDEFNNLVTLFYITYVTCDIFWVISIKKFGANRVLGVAMIGWSAATLGTGFAKNYGQAMACRLLLGVFESGLIPSMIFLISTIWNKQQQAKRVAVIYCATTVSGAFGGLIAYGIQTMGTRHGLEPWRWLFIIEGIISLVIGGAALFSIPFSAEQAWFLSVEQAELMRLRRERDFLFKGSDEFKWTHVWSAVKDPLVYLTAFSLFASSLPLFGFGVFLPTIILGLGFNSLEANYLTIPVYMLATVTVAFTAFMSDRLRKRALFLFVVPIPVLVGYSIAIGSPNPGAGYFAMFLCGAGIYPYNCLMLAWLSSNLSPDYKRSVGIPLAASIANISGVLSGQIYPPADAPRYVHGNAVSLGLEFVALAGVASIFGLLKWRTSRRAVARTDEVDQAPGFKYSF